MILVFSSVDWSPWILDSWFLFLRLDKREDRWSYSALSNNTRTASSNQLRMQFSWLLSICSLYYRRVRYNWKLKIHRASWELWNCLGGFNHSFTLKSQHACQGNFSKSKATVIQGMSLKLFSYFESSGWDFSCLCSPAQRLTIKHNSSSVLLVLASQGWSRSYSSHFLKGWRKGWRQRVKLWLCPLHQPTEHWAACWTFCKVCVQQRTPSTWRCLTEVNRMCVP